MLGPDDSERVVVYHVSSSLICFRRDRQILQEMKMLSSFLKNIIIVILKHYSCMCLFFRWSVSGRVLAMLYSWLMA